MATGKFRTREWVNDIAAGTLACLISGGIGAYVIADPFIGQTITTAGLVGFIAGLVNEPIRHILNLRPDSDSSRRQP
ncbi:MAG: hypothetical protein JOZ54_18430 [Acidobacteria bacterium]|nr:hypothetical protein [Acidobacteriota bacterium]